MGLIMLAKCFAFEVCRAQGLYNNIIINYHNEMTEASAVFILGLFGGNFPPKISDSCPKVVSDLVTAIYTTSV